MFKINSLALVGKYSYSILYSEGSKEISKLFIFSYSEKFKLEKIKTVGDLKNIVNSALRRNDKTLQITIYNNQGQLRSIGVKLD